MPPLLFPTDGSACAERARPWAERLAAALDAPLHVLHVEVVGAADLHPVPRPAPAAPGRPVEAVRRGPDPARAILGYAAEVGAGLVVVGTHGRRGFDRLVLGSVTDLLLRRAACPVLAVPCAGEATPPTLDGGRIVVADDLLEAAEGALAEGARLARATGAAVEVVHVVEEVRVPSIYGAITAPRQDLAALTPRVEAALRARAAAAGLAGAPVEVRSGDAVDEVLAFAHERGAALVVMGSHGRKGLGRVLLGSVAEGLVRRATRPALIVRVPARA